MLKRYAAGLFALAVAPWAGADTECSATLAEYSAVDQICPYTQGLARIQIRGAWGFLDTAGRLAIEPRFDVQEIENFSEGLAAVKIGERWGYLDREGKLRIEPRFEATYSFSDGLALTYQDDKAGYIDTTGAWAIEPRHARGGPFVDGVAAVYDEYGHSYLIDRKGGVVKRFDHPINIEDEPRHGVYRATLPAVRELLHRDGRRLTAAADLGSGSSYGEGLFIAHKTSETQGVLFGAMTPEGRWAVEPVHAELSGFVQGTAIAARPGTERLKGLIDTGGRWVVPARFSGLRRLETGLYEGMEGEPATRAEIFDARGRSLFSVDCGELSEKIEREWTVFAGCGASWAVHRSGKVHRVAVREPDVDSAGAYLLLTQDYGSEPEDDPEPGASRHAKTFALLNADGVLLSSESPEVKGRWDWAQLVIPKGPRAEAAPHLLPVAVLVRAYEQLGIVTRRHTIVSRPEWKYDSDSPSFSNSDQDAVDGPLPVKTEAGWGAIDGAGEWVIQPRYVRLSLFRHGLAYADSVVYDEARRDALIEFMEGVSEYTLEQLATERRELVIDSAGTEYRLPEGRGLSRVGPWTLQGYDDERRPFRYDLRTRKAKPMLAQDGAYREEDEHAGLSAARTEDRWGLMDVEGRWVMPPVYEEEPREVVQDGRMLGWKVSKRVQIGRDSDSVYGWATPEGRELIKPRYQGIDYHPRAGLFTIQLDGRYGVLDADGKPVLEPVYHALTVLDDGWILTEQSERRGLLDARGAWVVEPGLHTLDNLEQRPYASESLKDEPYLLRVDGTVSTPAQPQPFAGDKPEYWLTRIGRTADGDVVTEFHGFDWKTRLTLPGEIHGSFAEGRIAFDPEDRDGYAFADAAGRVYGPFPYAGIEAFADGRARFKQIVNVKGKRGQPDEELERYGYLDREGKVAIPARYESGDAFQERRAVVVFKGNLGVIDDAGRLLLHSAWRCGTDPVLLDGQGKVIWPADEAGACP